MLDNKKLIQVNATDNSIDDVIEYLTQSEYGAHYIIVYPDLSTLREIYSRYIKIQLKNDEIVLLLPYYETTDSMRRILLSQRSGGDDDNNSIDVRKYEKEGSLVIVDSIKAYFGSGIDIVTFVGMLVEHAKRLGKNGVSGLADMGSFYYPFDKINQLIKYETSVLPPKFDMRLKGFCCYHKKDFDRFTQIQKQELLEHHGRDIMVIG